MTNGWKCPGCGRCYSPIVMECAKCNATPTVATVTGYATCPRCNVMVQIGKPHECPGSTSGVSSV